MALELLLKEAKGMSDDALMEVVHYMRFLKIATTVDAVTDTAHNGKRKVRHAGKYSGKGWMADDFDAPLSDFREYM